MNLKQTVYFMALVGAIAGLACWTIAGLAAGLSSASSKRWVFGRACRPR